MNSPSICRKMEAFRNCIPGLTFPIGCEVFLWQENEKPSEGAADMNMLRNVCGMLSEHEWLGMTGGGRGEEHGSDVTR